jgi:hypothetical protein
MAHQSAINATLTAFYAALNVAGMTALATGGVFNGVPQRASFPYVWIGSVTENRLDCFQKPGKDLTVQVHVFTTDAASVGDKAAADIVSKAIELLHYQALTVTNHTLIACQYEQTFDAGADVEDGIGMVRHLVASFRVQLEQTA